MKFSATVSAFLFGLAMARPQGNQEEEADRPISEDGLLKKFSGTNLACLVDEQVNKPWQCQEARPAQQQSVHTIASLCQGLDCSECVLLSDRRFACKNEFERRDNAPPKAPEPSAGKGANPPSFSAEEKEAARNEACVDFKGNIEACLATGRKCREDLGKGGGSVDAAAFKDCLRSTAEKMEAARNELCADFKGGVKACELAGWECRKDLEKKGVLLDTPAFKDCLRSASAAAEKIETTKDELCADFKGDIEACLAAGRKCRNDLGERGGSVDAAALKDCLRNSAKAST